MAKKKVTQEVAVVKSKLPTIVEGVSTQNFEDACSVILADEISLAKENLRVAHNAMEVAREALFMADEKAFKAWSNALHKKIKGVLAEAGVSLESGESLRGGCHPFFSMRGELDLRVILDRGTLGEIYPYGLRGANLENLPSKMDSIPQAVKPLATDYLAKGALYKEAENRVKDLQERQANVGVEISRYRLSADAGMTPEQYQKVKDMLLRSV
jgi:hypothetical protein